MTSSKSTPIGRAVPMTTVSAAWTPSPRTMFPDDATATVVLFIAILLRATQSGITLKLNLSWNIFTPVHPSVLSHSDANTRKVFLVRLSAHKGAGRALSALAYLLREYETKSKVGGEHACVRALLVAFRRLTVKITQPLAVNWWSVYIYKSFDIRPIVSNERQCCSHFLLYSCSKRICLRIRKRICFFLSSFSVPLRHKHVITFDIAAS